MHINYAPVKFQTRLDLEAVELFGWESKKSLAKVNSFIEALRKGSVFPAVPVQEAVSGEYLLAAKIHTEWGMADGGHHRSIAHMMAGVPLLVKVVDLGSIEVPEHFVNIREIDVSAQYDCFSHD